MRMVFISLIILLMLIGIWAWFYYGSVDPVTTYYWDNLTHLSEIVRSENWERAKADISIYTEKWHDIKKIWIFF